MNHHDDLPAVPAAAPAADVTAPPPPAPSSDLRYTRYDGSREDEYVAAMRQLISKDLSEPYSIYVYRYFLYQWGDLCFMAMDDSRPEDPMVGVVVSKLEPHRGGPLRGYIAMLAVREEFRGRGIATKLVRMAIDAMIERDADEIALETEITNTAAIKLYERLGFLRSKQLHRYYLNGNSAYRLVLYLKEGVGSVRTEFDAYGPTAPEMSGAMPAPPPPALLHGNGSG
ncbi:peptide alpha-N-acetyltransferase MAK3 [Aspergillus melleus]|uniref:peptide alpha-N-acetyltransferase MAK3 n=1 Tax=Aspergillus melleus TaxID=138277 RepID=UPI001E8EF423|nr:N-alpha-acetyltransferase 30 [Aspergillus melleus]KAH8423919.1 N-alpha-acetyltransferase 30 [Aspergillus melleus]